MRLFVGLGNPGQKYAQHRHNVGFMAVDEIVRRHSFSPARQRFQSEVHEGHLAGRKIMIIKPTTYMNESGRAVGEAMRFYKLTPADIAVFHDELDLAPGKLRVKVGGGVAGHNGLKSIRQHIGAEFQRVRIGIGHPGDRDRVTGHVLGDFSKSDWPWVDALCGAMADAADQLALDDDAGFTSKVALILAPAKPKKETKPEIKVAEGVAANRDPEEG